MTKDEVEAQKLAAGAQLAERENITPDSTDSHHGLHEFGQQMQQMAMADTKESQEELLAVHEHVCWKSLKSRNENLIIITDEPPLVPLARGHVVPLGRIPDPPVSVR